MIKPKIDCEGGKKEMNMRAGLISGKSEPSPPYDTGVGSAELEQQAYLAVYEAVLKFEEFRGKDKEEEMKVATFVFWYLQKHLSRSINADNVIYDIYDDSGIYIVSFHGKEYYRKKYDLPEHSVKTRRAEIDLTTIFNSRDGDCDEDWTERVSGEVLK